MELQLTQSRHGLKIKKIKKKKRKLFKDFGRQLLDANEW